MEKKTNPHEMKNVQKYMNGNESIRKPPTLISGRGSG